MKTGFRIALAVTALTVAACGPTDPSDKNSSANGMTNGSTNGTPNGMTNGMTNGTPNGTTNGTPNGVTNNGMTNGATNGMTAGPCVVNDVFFGQVDAMNDDHAGGAPSTDALTTDAGLADAMAMFTAMEGETQTVDIDIAGATVIAANFGTGGNSNFWVQDSGAAIQVFLGFDNPVDVTVKLGDTVSFKITEFNNFGGTPQISVLSGFTVDSSGGAVPYADRTGMAVTEADYDKNVRIGGTLSATGTSCGGDSMCYDLTHDGQTIEYRTDSTFIEGGECVTYFGPLGGFPGPKNDGGTTPKWQLNVSNYSWSWTRFD